MHQTVQKMRWEVNFRPPIKRQNFGDVFRMNCNHWPISCPSQVRKLVSGNPHKFPEDIVEVKIGISVGEMRYISLSLFPFNLEDIFKKKKQFPREI